MGRGILGSYHQLACLGVVLLFPNVASGADDEDVASGEATVSRPEEWGDGVTVRSSGGRFELVTSGRIQFRHTSLFDAQDGSHDGELRIRRARLSFEGYAGSRDTRYEIELGLTPDDLGFEDDDSAPVYDAYVNFGQVRDLELRIGRARVPFGREQLVSSGDLQFVERSLASDEFAPDRDTGFAIHSEDFRGLGRFGYTLGLYSGKGRRLWRPSGAALLYVARFEVHPLATPKPSGEPDLERVEVPRLTIGAAYLYYDRAINDRGGEGEPPPDGATTDLHGGTIDLIGHWRGVSILAAGFLRWGERNAPPRQPMLELEPPRNAWGWSAEIGYIFPGEMFGIAARNSGFRPWFEPSSVEPENEAGLALSAYVVDHAFKVQADYSRRWSVAPSEGDHVAQLQFQVEF